MFLVVFVPSIRVKLPAVEKEMHCAKLSVGVQVAYDMDARRPTALSTLTVVIGLVEHVVFLFVVCG